MDQTEDVNSRCSQEEVVVASSYDWQDLTRRDNDVRRRDIEVMRRDNEVMRRDNEVMRRYNEVMRRLDAISLDYSQMLQEEDDLYSKLDNVHLEQKRIDQEENNLRSELDDIFALSQTDRDEDVDTSTDDWEDSVMKRLDALALETRRMDDEQNDITRRLDAISLGKSQLDQEEHNLRQEDAELSRKLQDVFKLSETDQDEDVDPSTDEEDSTGELDEDMFLALSQMASDLCTNCRNLLRGRIVIHSDHASRLHHPSVSSLEKSVDAGCRLCVELAEALEKFCTKSDPPANKREFWSFGCNIDAYGPWRTLDLKFYLCQCESVHPDGTKCEHAQGLRGMDFLPARKVGLGPEFLGASTGNGCSLSTASANLSAVDPSLRTSSAKSAASFAVARSWYQQCLNHATCRNWRRETRALPTRLIQIRGPDNQSSDLSAKICETKGLPTSTPYATLSHCWGGEVIFRLLKSNLYDLSQAIPIGQLPNVFRDAIRVSFELGISYLWIDSLCIIQDSKEDWTYEAKRMGDVYLHGEFNISATSYEDGSSGLFGERKAMPLVNLPLCVDCVIVNKEYKEKMAFKGIYVRWDCAEFHDKISNGYLFTRAWVAQERALSAAIIHYTPEKIWWECNQEIFSEAFTKNTYLNGLLIWTGTEGSGRDRVRSLSTQSEPEEIYLFWKTFLNKHGGAFLSFYRDRFPAFAGIARILGELIDDDLVAGFWSGDLVRSLIMEFGSTRIAIQPEQLAPSWSWVSLCTTPVSAGTEEARIKPLDGVRIIRVLSHTPGFKSDLQSTYFEKSGVRGLAIRGALRRLPEDFGTKPKWCTSMRTTSDHERSCKSKGKDNIPEEQQWRLKDPTHMLLLAAERDETVDAVYGLLVQTAEVEEANTFRRTGTIEFRFFTRDREKKWDECLGLVEKNEEYEASLEFPERGFQDLVLI